jgi:hypothetical protein
MIRRRTSTEEQVATKIGDLIDKVSLDLDQIGMFLARDNNITYNRLMVIAEAAEFEKETQSGKQFDTLF